jgi:carbamoyl-phosphate synthase small subunit
MNDDWKLVLEDGAVYHGVGFGAGRPTCGEVVFNTGMTGYVEALSDPSYRGQILVLTYPLIGNYGVPWELLHTGLPHPFESAGLQVLGLVVSRYEPSFSHHAAVRSLASWLEESELPAIAGVDTRGLTRKLREQGTMRGKLVPASEDDALPADTFDARQLVSQVSRPGVDRFDADAGSKRLLLVDCGAKHNILRSLLKRGINVTRVHFDHDFVADDLGADGLFLSNGPGDPTDVPALIERVRGYLALGKPVFGICLGHQILGLAAGGFTFRLPYGHRSQNQPVVDRLTRRGYITSQNHGYGVDSARLPEGFYEWFTNVNDDTNEGIRHARRPWMSVQFHPEAYPGPVETGVLFDEFVQVLHDA